MSVSSPLPSALCIMAGLVLASAGHAQTSLTFVKDINTNAASSVVLSSYPSVSRSRVNLNSQRWPMMGGWFYFSARTWKTGQELFKSNGTQAILVKDIERGAASSSPIYFTVVGFKIFFSARTAGNGSELWVSDGTSTGTRLVKDIVAGGGSSNPKNFGSVGTKLLFTANDGVKGDELWVSDGTAAGTRMLKDIRIGLAGAMLYTPVSTRAGNLAFFQANDGINGTELWATDGTSAGTRMVKNIRVRSESSYPAQFLQLGTNKVLFMAMDRAHGYELWVSNGTAAGTVLVKDVYPGTIGGTSLNSGVSLGNKILFEGKTAAKGAEPWISDGTPAGTMLLKEVRAGSLSSYMHFSDSDGGKAYFAAYNGTQYEIWVTNGTPAGTRRFSNAGTWRYKPYNIAATNGKVFFVGYNMTAGTGYELCMTNGVTTAAVKDIYPGVRSSVSTYSNYCSKIGNGIVAISANNGKNGQELWISKGTAATTSLIDINVASGPAATDDDNVTSIEPLFGKLLFSATDGTIKSKGQHGQELWVSDGTATGTKLLKDIFVGPSTTYAYSSSPRDLCRLGKYVYFSAYTSTHGYELWRTDGTASGTRLFADLRRGSASSYPRGMTRIKDKIYFQANNGYSGSEVWVTDGTPTGTRMVKDIYLGSGSSWATGFTRLGNSDKCVFSALTKYQGAELWITNGTGLGTKRIKDISRGYNSSSPSYLRSLGNKVYFQAVTAASGYELWETDGSSGGTKIVKDLAPGSSSGYALYIEVQNKKLYFSSWSSKTGFEMYSSNGTAAGTALYWNLNPGAASTSPGYITAVGSRRIFFQGNYSTSTTAYGIEPLYFDVTTRTFGFFDAYPRGSSIPSNNAGGSRRFAVDGGSVFMKANRSTKRDNQLVRIVNGATARSIGRAQASSSMTATDPRIGKNMLLAGKTSVSNPLTVVCLGVPDSLPLGIGALAPKSYSYFQLTNFFIIVGNMPGIAWATAMPVPNDATLIGKKAVLQSFVLNALTFPIGTEVSNGFHITFGR